MELQLKNIGMIKEANVKIDGLTVIAGENDTGKTTVGKALVILLKTIQDIELIEQNDIQFSLMSYNFMGYYSLLFKEKKLPKGAFFKFHDFKNAFLLEVKEVSGNNKENISIVTPSIIKFDNTLDITFIESPLVWNLTDFFRDIALIESKMNIEIDYPYLMKDLNFKLFIKNATNGVDIKEKMTSLMDGEFEKDEKGSYFFSRNGKRIELVNTATGIKMFGIFQVLSQNNYLTKDTILVLDEPEVHLHPKWQLEMAKIIVELVKNGVKVLVNSHSPYMIEALEIYSSKQKINSNFYLAEKKDDQSIIIDVTDNLEPIYEKLATAIETLEEESMENFKW